MQLLKPLGQRDIALLWSGQVLAATGTQLYLVAIIWIATGLLGKDAGYVSGLQAAVLFLGSLLSGVVTDRFRHGTTLIAMDLLRVACLALLSVAAIFGTITLPLLLVAMVGVALGGTAFEPALQATLPALVKDGALRHATNALFDATRRLARVLGPGLVALINGVLATDHFFILTGATFLLSALVLLGLARRINRLQTTEGPALKGLAGIIDSVWGGVRVVRGHGLMIYSLIANMIGNFTWSMGLILGMALYLRAESGDALTHYGQMMAAYGIGNLGANLVLSAWQPRHPRHWIIASKFLFGGGVALLPLMADPWWLMGVALVAALNGPLENLANLHLMQNDFPPQRLAQLYRLQMCAIFAGQLIAYLAAPTLFGWLGVAPGIVCAGLLTLAAGIAGIAMPRGKG